MNMENSNEKESTLNAKEWFFLYEIELAKIRGESILASQLPDNIDFSQQTISRRINGCVDKGLIEKNPKNKSFTLELTSKGFKLLQEVSNNLRHILSNAIFSTYFSGNLKAGLGEGAYYVQKKGYAQQFKDELGYEPFPGTLNLYLNPGLYELFIKGQTNENIPSKTIAGFNDGKRQFGDVKCYLVELWCKKDEDKKVKGVLLQIQRTSHKEGILEFVAKEELREYFNIKNEDPVLFRFIEEK